MILQSAPSADEALDPWSVRFLRPDLEDAFRAYSRAKDNNQDRLVILSGVFIYLIYGILDWLTLGDGAAWAITLRFLVAPVMVGLLAWTYTEKGAYHVTSAYVLVVLLVGGSINLMIYAKGSVSPPYYVGLLHVSIVISALARVNFRIVCGLLIYQYVGFVLAAWGFEAGPDLSAGHFFTSMAFVSCASVTYYLERNRRLEYLEFRAKEHYYAQVKVMAEEAELSVRRKNALLNVLGHVVKTPLHQIIGYAQIIEQSEALPPEEEQISSFAEEIRRAGQALSYQSQRILDYSRAEADLIGSQFHDSNAARMVREAIYRHEDSIREKHINVKIGCGETPIRVDTRHVIRALDELIDNAVRYCPPGSNILITTEETVGGLALTIADDGPGIAEGDINRVGDALNQTEEFRNMGGDKLGIGVSLAHILLKLGGGKLHFCSIPDIGTVARVIFPRTTKPPKENGTATRSTQKVA